MWGGVGGGARLFGTGRYVTANSDIYQQQERRAVKASNKEEVSCRFYHLPNLVCFCCIRHMCLIFDTQPVRRLYCSVYSTDAIHTILYPKKKIKAGDCCFEAACRFKMPSQIGGSLSMAAPSRATHVAITSKSHAETTTMSFLIEFLQTELREKSA